MCWHENEPGGGDASTSLLFPEPTQRRDTYLGWAEPNVAWYAECTLPEAAASRAAVNAWYRAFPDQDGDLATRLRSRDDVLHRQALDELFVHHLLTKAPYDICYEEGGEGPDFRLFRDGRLVAAVEVASLFTRQEWTDKLQRYGRIADELNRRLDCSAGYFVRFEIERLERTPSFKRLVRWVREQLDALPPPGQRDDIDVTGPPSAVYEEHSTSPSGGEASVRLRFSFLPTRPGAPSRTDPDARIIAFGPMVGGFVNSGERLQDVLARKGGGRYKLPDGTPFTVVVVRQDVFASDYEVDAALYGGESVDVNTGAVHRRPDGFFGASAGHPQGRNRRVSAVAVLDPPTPWQPDRVRLLLGNNPHAVTTWPTEVFSPDHVFTVVESDQQSERWAWVPPLEGR